MPGTTNRNNTNPAPLGVTPRRPLKGQQGYVRLPNPRHKCLGYIKDIQLLHPEIAHCYFAENQVHFIPELVSAALIPLYFARPEIYRSMSSTQECFHDAHARLLCDTFSDNVS
jgi:hypothetical protein